jgi:hypothetical protein
VTLTVAQKCTKKKNGESRKPIFHVMKPHLMAFTDRETQEPGNKEEQKRKGEREKNPKAKKKTNNRADPCGQQAH